MKTATGVEGEEFANFVQVVVEAVLHDRSKKRRGNRKKLDHTKVSLRKNGSPIL